EPRLHVGFELGAYHVDRLAAATDERADVVELDLRLQRVGAGRHTHALVRGPGEIDRTVQRLQLRLGDDGAARELVRVLPIDAQPERRVDADAVGPLGI